MCFAKHTGFNQAQQLDQNRKKVILQKVINSYSFSDDILLEKKKKTTNGEIMTHLVGF